MTPAGGNRKTRGIVVSIGIDAYCENYEELFVLNPKLPKSSTITGSEKISSIAFASTYMDCYEGEYDHFFEYLEYEHDLDDILFGPLSKKDKLRVAPAKAVKYFKQLLGILRELKAKSASEPPREAKSSSKPDAENWLLGLLGLEPAEIPFVYSFVDSADGSMYVETSHQSLRLQAGYDHCVLIDESVKKSKATDLRRKPATELGGRKFGIVRTSIHDFASDDFLAMLKVAETADHYDRKFVLEAH
jgi:hypothetical protein